MNAQRPILILTASAGAGHTVAARALAEAFATSAPARTVEVIDVLDLANAFFRRLYAQGYLGLVRHAPGAMGWLYETMDRPDRPLRERLRVAFQRLNLRGCAHQLVARDPALIVNTHFLPAEIVAELRRRGAWSVPQATVTTDFETHRMWVHEPTERYYTATEEGKAYLATWRVPPERIVVSGIPVRAAFEQPLDREAARRALGLPERRPMVLLLCGGFGVGPTGDLLRELMRLDDTVQIVVVTGRNAPLRERLNAIAEAAPQRVGVVGFTDRMHEYMRAADLVVTKPGGLTASEALVCGLPIVVVNPIPGQEARNSDHLLEHGAAIKVNNPRLLGHRVGALLTDPNRLARLRAAAAALARPGAAERIVRDVLGLLGGFDAPNPSVVPTEAAPVASGGGSAN
ncbi:MAG: glycosyltransferase [Phycisphaerae bacterium]